MATPGCSPKKHLTKTPQVVLFWTAGRYGHERGAAVGPRHQGRQLQPVVGAFDCAGTDGQSHRQGTDGRQLVAGQKLTAEDEPADLPFDLPPDRAAAIEHELSR